LYGKRSSCLTRRIKRSNNIAARRKGITITAKDSNGERLRDTIKELKSGINSPIKIH